MTDQIEYFENARIENNLHTVWSIDEVTDIKAQPAVKVEGKTVVYTTIKKDATYQDILDDLKTGSDRTTETFRAEVKGNTWLSLWQVANDLIVKSGTHHSYIEDFSFNDNGELELTTGS
jgi:hypothetical protein